MSSDADILYDRRGHLAIVTMNRPRALNALSHEMALQLHGWLEDWRHDDSVACVLIRGAGDKAFCAGGDVRRLYDEGLARKSYPYNFYRDEYALNSAIYHYPKPYVALMDGIVMGGGVGVSVHGSHRVANEQTMFAMPETGIGLFPDVGGSSFLSRLPGEIGLYMALTGARLRGADAVYAGVADCFIPAAHHDDVIADLARLDCDDDGFAAVSALLSSFATAKGDSAAGPSRLAGDRAFIDRHFSHANLDAVCASLAADASPAADEREWAAKTLATMMTKSPTSMRIAFRQLRSGREMIFDDCLHMEYRLACGCIEGVDFYEGVRAVVIDKDQTPVWQPAHLSDLDDNGVADYFDKPASAGDLALVNTAPENFCKYRMNASFGAGA